MANKGEDQDVQAVRREEMSRGRQPIDTNQLELKRKFKRDFEELLLNRDRKQFRLFLIAHGQEEGGRTIRGFDETLAVLPEETASKPLIRPCSTFSPAKILALRSLGERVLKCSTIIRASSPAVFSSVLPIRIV